MNNIMQTPVPLIMNSSVATIRPDAELEQNQGVSVAVDPTGRTYRTALGKFSTGVTIVTTLGDQGPIGMTVNSFASVSLDPALVLWSVSHKSERCQAFIHAPRYAIHVLAEDQFDFAMAFARNADVFDDGMWHSGEGGVPLSNHMLARFECVKDEVHQGGDHSILVGRVERFHVNKGKPLVFSGGEFGGFVGQNFDDQIKKYD